MEAKVKSSGAFVFWTCSAHTDRDTLLAKMAGTGYDGRVPAPLSPEAALKEAMESLCGKSKHAGCGAGSVQMIRPTAEKGQYCVVTEERGVHGNAYPQKLICKVDTTSETIEMTPYDSGLYLKLRAEYTKFRGSVDGSMVGSMLIGIVKLLNGVSIRKSGGIYWIPSKSVSEWRVVAKSVEAVGNGNVVYTSTMDIDSESVRAVRDAIRSEVLSQANFILHEVNKMDLGDKALDQRMALLTSIDAKVSEYEGIVGESLTDLRGAVDACATAIGLASFKSLATEIV